MKPGPAAAGCAPLPFSFMNKKAFGVFSIALASLLLELVLIRIFDVLWYPNMAYMIITLAMFSIGVSGVLVSLT